MNKSGFTIIEIVLAISLFALISLGAISSILYGQNAQIRSGEGKRATLLADQTIEILRAVRDSYSQGFGALSNGTYGLDRDLDGAWILVPNAPDTVDNFLRTVTISSVDSNTKQINADICWPSANCGKTVSLVTYLTNWRGEAPTAPSALSASAVSSSAIDLSWLDNSTNEDNFVLERHSSHDGFSIIATLGPDVTWYHDTGLSGSTVYHYRIKATNAGGDSAYSDVVSVETGS